VIAKIIVTQHLNHLTPGRENYITLGTQLSTAGTPLPDSSEPGFDGMCINTMSCLAVTHRHSGYNLAIQDSAVKALIQRYISTRSALRTYPFFEKTSVHGIAGADG
jgi:hypothetical protein